MQAVENTFAIAKKVPLGECFCEPFGGFKNNTIERMQDFAQYNETVCKVNEFVA